MSYEKEIQRLCSVPENLRSHWPPELLWAVQAFEDLEKRAIRLSERLDFLEESLEQREYCDSVLQEYEQKFFQSIKVPSHFLLQSPGQQKQSEQKDSADIEVPT
jgi:hypothetical protein